MKRIASLLLLALLIGSSCARPVVYNRPNYPHDNGRHTGWYKNGQGMPPGQAKKRGW